MLEPDEKAVTAATPPPAEPALLTWLEKPALWAERAIPWLLVPFAALTFLIVVLRYGFNYGRIDMQEGVVYLHATVIALGMAAALKRDAHVRVDIFYARMSARRRALVDFVGALLFLLPVAVVIFLFGWDYALKSWRLLEGSPDVGGLPLVFALKTLIPLMAALLVLQGAAQALRAWRALRRGA